MNVLGINAYHGDSSAALFTDGNLAVAVEEERFNRIKHWAGLPCAAIQECLRTCGVGGVDHIAISRDPHAHLWRKVVRAAARPHRWGRLSVRARNSAEIAMTGRRLQAAGLARKDVSFHFVEHHRAHLASAFFCSPFERSAVLSVDGFGDFSSVMWGIGSGNRITILGSVLFPHSLGLFYTAFTQFLGFPKYGDEYKMMGLAAYGEPRFVDRVRQVVRTSDGQCRLNLEYFTHHSRGVDMTWDGGEPQLGEVYSKKMRETFGEPRVPRSEVTERHSDIAASVQTVLEENYFALLNHVYRETKEKNLCLAGGVALNCAANGKIFQNTPFERLYIQPGAHDSGTSIGAALYTQHQILNQPRTFVMKHVYYGPEHDDSAVLDQLKSAGLTYRRLPTEELLSYVANAIADGKILGWFQGRMEFGPRALGNRSILADPRSDTMKEVLNSRIKYREPFRPFCPSILAEHTSDYFEMDAPAPFMVTAYKIRPQMRSRIRAVTHADGTGRLQTVERDSNPLYWSLIKRFYEITGVPVLLNTSFNENEPIVNTPREAVECFLRTEMDVLAIGSYLLLKSENHHVTPGRTPYAVAEAKQDAASRQLIV